MKKFINAAFLLGLFVFVISTTNIWEETATASDRAVKTSLPTGWVKLLPASTTQTHNAYSVNKKIGTFGAFGATNVKEGDAKTDATIPDGEYYVTFWVTGKTRSGRDVVDVEHKQKMEFKGGKMQGEIRLTVGLGTITSAGVSFPP